MLTAEVRNHIRRERSKLIKSVTNSNPHVRTENKLMRDSVPTRIVGELPLLRTTGPDMWLGERVYQGTYQTDQLDRY